VHRDNPKPHVDNIELILMNEYIATLFIFLPVDPEDSAVKYNHKVIPNIII
jgi:hypothetical protein